MLIGSPANTIRSTHIGPRGHPHPLPPPLPLLSPSLTEPSHPKVRTPPHTITHTKAGNVVSTFVIRYAAECDKQRARRQADVIPSDGWLRALGFTASKRQGKAHTLSSSVYPCIHGNTDVKRSHGKRRKKVFYSSALLQQAGIVPCFNSWVCLWFSVNPLGFVSRGRGEECLCILRFLNLKNI